MTVSKLATLAALSAAALTAFAWAGTASADTLCSTNTSPCTGVSYGSPVVVSADQKGTSELVGTFPVKCTGGFMGGLITSATGVGAVEGEISSWSFTGCKLFNVITCTPSTSLAGGGNYRFEATASGGGVGTLTVKTGSQEPLLKFACGTTTCEFGAADLSLGFDGSATEPLLTALGAGATRLAYKGGSGAAMCGANAEWKATYKVTGPSPVFPIVGA